MIAASSQLRFRLPGEWISLDPQDAEASAHTARIARELVGTADDAAGARRRVRSGLDEAVSSAREARARLLLLCREIAPGIPIPVSISVHDPVQVTPAVGTGAEQVMRAFELSLPHTSEPDLDTATRLALDGSIALRLHSVTGQEIEEDGQRVTQNRLAARYWITVPGTKQVALVSVATPLGDIPHAMLRFFDAIVAAAYWADPTP